MALKDQPPNRSEQPPPDLHKEREELLHHFSRGSRLGEEVVGEHQALMARLRALEEENAKLRARVEADQAVRELLEKIAQLEREKQELISRNRQAEEASTAFNARFEEFEREFSNLANLFVAANQMHATLVPREVAQRIKEVLAQLVGAERYAVYLHDPERGQLVPIASEGLASGDLVTVRVSGTALGDAFTTGTLSVTEGDPRAGSLTQPAATVPLRVDDQLVGVVAVYSTLSQKDRLGDIDVELFRLLGQHAAAALIAACLFAAAGRKVPGLESFVDLSV
jgi:vacuolar-type H+-ATPase subunit E/Vma4